MNLVLVKTKFSDSMSWDTACSRHCSSLLPHTALLMHLGLTCISFHEEPCQCTWWNTSCYFTLFCFTRLLACPRCCTWAVLLPSMLMWCSLTRVDVLSLVVVAPHSAPSKDLNAHMQHYQPSKLSWNTREHCVSPSCWIHVIIWVFHLWSSTTKPVIISDNV